MNKLLLLSIVLFFAATGCADQGYYRRVTVEEWRPIQPRHPICVQPQPVCVPQQQMYAPQPRVIYMPAPQQPVYVQRPYCPPPMYMPQPMYAPRLYYPQPPIYMPAPRPMYAPQPQYQQRTGWNIGVRVGANYNLGGH